MHVRLALVLSALLLVPACSGDAGASGSVAGIADQLTKVLAGITDAKTAESAKEQVTSLTDEFAKAFGALKSSATDAGEKAKGALGDSLGGQAGDLMKKATDALPDSVKSALGGVSKEVERLLASPEVQNVLGTTLEKLKGLVAG